MPSFGKINFLKRLTLANNRIGFIFVILKFAFGKIQVLKRLTPIKRTSANTHTGRKIDFGPLVSQSVTIISLILTLFHNITHPLHDTYRYATSHIHLLCHNPPISITFRTYHISSYCSYFILLHIRLFRIPHTHCIPYYIPASRPSCIFNHIFKL